MTLAIILVLAAAVALALILRISFRRGLRVSPATLATQLEPIDIEAFRNLVDATEDDYLRQRLPASEFRRVQRQRLRAMAAYVQAAGTNAAVLVRLGQSALGTPDAATAEAGRQLVESALLLRRNATMALLRTYLALAWPNKGLAATPILRGYEQLSSSAMRLGRLQNPAMPVRIAVNL